jgi:hypothetical protein
MAAEFYLAHEEFTDGIAAIEDDSPAGADVRQRLGEALVRDVGAMFRTNGMQLGYRYEDSPVCVADGSAPYPDDPEHFVPSTRPGSRAPHVWLGEGRSTLDLFGRGFVLLRLGADTSDGTAFEAAAAERHVPLRTVALEGSEAIALYERPLVLVRPDGHVAWRGSEMPADAGAVIDYVRGTLHFVRA